MTLPIRFQQGPALLRFTGHGDVLGAYWVLGREADQTWAHAIHHDETLVTAVSARTQPKTEVCSVFSVWSAHDISHAY